MKQKLKNTLWQIYDFAHTHDSDIVDIVVHTSEFVGNPNFSSAISFAANMYNDIGEMMSTYASRYFANGSWSKEYRGTIAAVIISLLKDRYDVTNIKTKDQSTKVQYVTVESGLQIYWRFDEDTRDITQVYVKVTYINALHAFIKKLFVDTYCNKPLVMTCINNVDFSFNIDELVEAMPSQIASKYAIDFAKAFKCSENRSLMLYGPPGSGKSTIARQIAKELGLQSIRINANDIDELDIISDIVKVVSPDCFIIDDFDRASSSSLILDAVSMMRKNTKLVIATANDKSVIDPALLRPGRFDELMYVKTLDADVIKNILGDDSDQIFDHVKNWPIAFIIEYKRRRKWQSIDEASQSLIELAHRVKDIYDCDTDDITSLLNVKNSKKTNKKQEV